MDFSDLIRTDAPPHRVDKHGIVYLDSEDFCYRGVSRGFFDEILSAPGRYQANSPRLLDPLRGFVDDCVKRPNASVQALAGALGGIDDA